MNTKEYRIGNLLHVYTTSKVDEGEYWPIGTPKVCRVCSINDDAVFVNHKFDGSMILIRPIKLTMTWLGELGWTNKGEFVNKIALKGNPPNDMDGNILFKKGNCNIYFDINANEVYYELAMHSDDYGFSITTHKIEYVHQLQNIHAIIGEEEL